MMQSGFDGSLNNPLPPDAMTPRQRLAEVADLLAAGFLRHRALGMPDTHTSSRIPADGVRDHLTSPARRAFMRTSNSSEGGETVE